MLKSVTQYVTNVGKSVTYATIDVIKQQSPGIDDFISTNQELFKDINYAFRDRKQLFKRLDTTIKNSKIYEAADLGRKSLFEDLKTGKFYNKERIQKYQKKALGFEDFDSDLEGINFDESDIGIDFSLDGFNDDINLSDGEIAIVDSVESTSKSSAAMISNVVAKSSDYIVQSNKAISKMNLVQNVELFNGINKGLNVLNESLMNSNKATYDLLTTHANNSKTYYEESTKYQRDSFNLLKELVEMERNRYANEQSNEDNNKIGKRFDDLTTAEGIPNLENYFKIVGKNIKNSLSTLNSMNSLVGEDSNALLLFAASPLTFLSTYASKSILGKVVNDSMKRFNKTVESSFATFITKINEMRKNDDNIIFKTIGDILGIDTRMKTTIDTNRYNKGATQWNGKSEKALQYVIPTLLSKILSAVSGNEEHSYDYEQGKFIKITDIEKSYDNLLKSTSRSSGGRARQEVEKLSDQFRFRNYNDQKRYKDDIDKFFDFFFKQGIMFDHNKRDYDYYFEKGLDIDKNNYDLIESMFKTLPREIQMEFSKSILNARDSLNQQINNFEKNGSLYDTLFNNSKNMQVSKIDKEQNKVKTSGIISMLNDSKDKYGKNIFFYLKELRDILLEGINVYNLNGNDYTSSNIRNLSTNNTQNSNIINNIINRRRNSYLYPINEGRPVSEIEENRYDRENESIQRLQNRENSSVKSFDRVEYIDDFNVNEEDKAKRLRTRIKNNAYDRKIYNDSKKERGSLHKFFSDLLETDNVSEKMSKIIDRFKSVVESPRKLFSSAIDIADIRLYEAFYGSEKEYYEGEEVHGIVDILKVKIKNTFTKLNDFLDEKILTPLTQKLDSVGGFSGMFKRALNTLGINTESESFKNLTQRLFGEDSLYGKAKKETKEAASSLYRAGRNAVRDTVEEVSGIINNSDKNDVETGNTASENIRETANIVNNENGINVGNRTLTPDEQDAIDDANNGGEINSFDVGSEYIDKTQVALIHEGEYIGTKEENEERMKNKSEATILKDSVIEGVIDEANNTIRMVKLSLLGTENTENFDKKISKLKKDFVTNLDKYFPKLASGGILGGIAGTLLMANPLLGATVGAAAQLTINSKEFREYLFGEKVDGKYQGGALLGKKSMGIIQKYLPSMSKYGLTGAVASLIPFIPGGPLAGLMVGGTIGFLKENEEMRKSIFGENFDPEKGFKVIKKKLPKMAFGAIATSMLGPFGFVGNAMLGSVLGWYSDTEKFKNFVYGTYDEKKKEYTGGLLPSLREIAIKPVIRVLNYAKDGLDKFIKTQVFEPLKFTAKSFAREGKHLVKWVASGISKLVTKMFESTVGKPIQKFLEEKVFTPLGKTFGFLGERLIDFAKFTITSPVRLLSFPGDKLANNRLRKGGIDEFEDDELLYRYNKNNGKFRKNLKKSGMTDREIEDVISRITSKKEKSNKIGDDSNKVETEPNEIDKDNNRQLNDISEAVQDVVVKLNSIINNQNDNKESTKRKNKKVDTKNNKSESDNKDDDKLDSLTKETQKVINQLTIFNDNQNEIVKEKYSVEKEDDDLYTEILIDNNNIIRNIDNTVNELFKFFYSLVNNNKNYNQTYDDNTTILNPVEEQNLLSTSSIGMIETSLNKQKLLPPTNSKYQDLFNSFIDEEDKKLLPAITSGTALTTIEQELLPAIIDNTEEVDCMKEIRDAANVLVTKVTSIDESSSDTSKAYMPTEHGVIRYDVDSSGETRPINDNVYRSYLESESEKQNGLLSSVSSIINNNNEENKEEKNSIFDTISDVIGGLVKNLSWLAPLGAIILAFLEGKSITRTDADGTQIENWDLKETLTTQAIKKGTQYGLKGISVGLGGISKTFSAVDNVGKTVSKTVKGVKNKFSKNASDDIAEAAVKNSDEFVNNIVVNSADDIIEGTAREITENASDDILKVAGKERLLLTGPVSNISDDIIEGTAREITEETVEKTVKNTATESIESTLNKTNNSLVKSFISKAKEFFTDKIGKIMSKVGSETTEKAASKAPIVLKKIFSLLKPENVAKFTDKLSKGAAKMIPFVSVVTGTWAALTGGTKSETAHLFMIPEDKVTFPMRVISSALKLLLNIGFAFVLDILNDISIMILKIDFINMLAVWIYESCAELFGDDEALQKLNAAQDEFISDYETYKQENGLEDLSLDAYNDKVNKSTATKLKENIGGAIEYVKENGVVKSVIHGTATVAKGAVNVAKNVGTTVIDGIKTLTPKIGNIVKPRLEYLMKNNPLNVVGNVYNAINSDLPLMDKLTRGFAAVIESMTFGIVDKDTALKGVETTVDIGKKIGGVVKDAAAFFFKFTPFNMPYRVYKGFNETEGSFGDKMMGALGGATEAITFGAVKTQDVIDNKETIKNAITNFGKSVIDGIKETVKWNPMTTIDRMKEGYDSSDGKTFKDKMVDSLKYGLKAMTFGVIDVDQIVTTYKELDDKGIIDHMKDMIKKSPLFAPYTFGEGWKAATNNGKGPIGKFTTGLAYALESMTFGIINKDDMISFFDSFSTKDIIGSLGGFLKTVLGFNDEDKDFFSSNNEGSGKKSGKGKSKINDTEYNYEPVNTNIPNYSQKDPRWSNIKYNTGEDTIKQTLGDSGCAPMSAAIVQTAYKNKAVNPVNIAKYSLDNGYKNENGGTNINFFKDYLSTQDIYSKETNNTEDVINSLKNNKPVILLGKENNSYTPFNGSSKGHYVVATGLNKNGDVIINDPEDYRPGAIYNLKDTLSATDRAVITSGKKIKNNNINFTNNIINGYGTENPFIVRNSDGTIPGYSNNTKKIDLSSSYKELQGLVSVSKSIVNSIFGIDDENSSTSLTTNNSSSSSGNVGYVDYSKVSKSEIIERINNRFKNAKVTKLRNTGQYYYDEYISKGKTFDPILAAAITWAETGGSSNPLRDKNNPGGLMRPSSEGGGLKTFSTIKEGIGSLCTTLSNYNTRDGLTTIEDIGQKYCPVGADNDDGSNKNWIGNVTKIYNDMTEGLPKIGESSYSSSSGIEAAVSFAESIANDESHGYDQSDRWGNPNYDCSGLVISSLEKAGIPAKTNGASYTGNMYNALIKSGLKDVTSSVNFKTGSGLKRGDVLLTPNRHTEFYSGNNKMVGARINENGGIKGGKDGDQTGKEIAIGQYRNYPWTYALRANSGFGKDENKNSKNKISKDLTNYLNYNSSKDEYFNDKEIFEGFGNKSNSITTSNSNEKIYYNKKQTYKKSNTYRNVSEMKKSNEYINNNTKSNNNIDSEIIKLLFKLVQNTENLSTIVTLISQGLDLNIPEELLNKIKSSSNNTSINSTPVMINSGYGTSNNYSLDNNTKSIIESIERLASQ